MYTDSNEITALKRTVWRTAISSRVERFSALLNDPEVQKYFGESFVTQLSAKIDRLFRTILVLGAIYGILIVSLFAAQDPNKSEFQILGYSFKNLAYFKEFLLFAAALLSPISSVVSAYHRYLAELRKVALKKIFPGSHALEFASHIYGDRYFDPLLKDREDPYLKPHGFTSLLVAAFGLVLAVVLVAFMASSFVLLIAVIRDVATHPSSSPFINHFIVGFSLSAIALSWLIGALQFPLPDVDHGGALKLIELRAKDPQKYQETVRRLGSDSARRERTWLIGSSLAIFVLTFSVIAIPSIRTVLLWPVLFKFGPGMLFVVMVTTSTASRIKRRIYSYYFRKYPEGSDPGLRSFTRATKIITSSRLALALFASISYSLLAS
jgi:hypothetical protein